MTERRCRRQILAAAVLLLPAGGACQAGLPGNGSMPDRRPDYIRLGPKPQYPRDFLAIHHVRDSRCGRLSSGRLELVNSQQHYRLRVALARHQPDGSIQRRSILLPPHSAPRSIGCDGGGPTGNSTNSRWEIGRLRFEAPPRGPGPGSQQE